MVLKLHHTRIFTWRESRTLRVWSLTIYIPKETSGTANAAYSGNTLLRTIALLCAKPWDKSLRYNNSKDNLFAA